MAMLTNLDSLPLDRICQMLRSFIDPETSVTDDQIKNLLAKKIQDNSLVLEMGQYKLNKV